MLRRMLFMLGAVVVVLEGYADPQIAISRVLRVLTAPPGPETIELRDLTYSDTGKKKGRIAQRPPPLASHTRRDRRTWLWSNLHQADLDGWLYRRRDPL